jgi:hypothetical protein
MLLTLAKASWTTFSHLTRLGRRVVVRTGSYSSAVIVLAAHCHEDWFRFLVTTRPCLKTFNQQAHQPQQPLDRGRVGVAITYSTSPWSLWEVRFSPLSDEVKLYINQLVGFNPKTTAGTIMGRLVEHASFADRYFLTGTCGRADTTRKVRAY